MLTMVAIVISSFSFKGRQDERFSKAVAEDDSLFIRPLPLIEGDDPVVLSSYQDQDVLLIFWASWSGKSKALLKEIDFLSTNYPELVILGAVVLDARDTLGELPEYSGFTFVDGAKLYNTWKVPGIPSYVFVQRSGLTQTGVGYKPEETIGRIRNLLNEN